MSTGEKTEKSWLKSTGLVSAATACSRILGLVREQVMAYYFGAGMATDAFVTAYRIPNLLRDMFAEGALSSAFVPVFKEKMVDQSNDEAFKLANSIFSLLIIVVGFIVLLGIVAAPAIIYITANGFVPDIPKYELTIALTRIMMIYLLLVSLSALVMGMLNSFGRFGIPAISPAMFNLGTIMSVIVLYQYFDQPAYTLAIGVVIGGVGQGIVQIPALLQTGYRFKFSFHFLDEGVKKVIRLVTPMIVGLSAGRINILLNTLIASFLIEGAISYLNYSYRLMHFPMGVFAVAIGTVALPRVSEMVARNEHGKLKSAFADTINTNMFVIIPSAVILAVWGREIIDLIFSWGRFNADDSANTAQALFHYAYGLIGFAAVRVTVPFYYAFGDSKLPMRVSVVAVAVNMILYWPMIQFLNFAGLAAATSLSGLLNFSLLAYYLPRKGVEIDYKSIGLNIAKILVAALVAFIAVKFIPENLIAVDSILLNRLTHLLVPLLTGGAVYILLCLLLKVEGLSKVKRRLNLN